MAEMIKIDCKIKYLNPVYQGQSKEKMIWEYVEHGLGQFLLRQRDVLNLKMRGPVNRQDDQLTQWYFKVSR